MLNDWTDEEEKIITLVAEKDEWDRDVLDRAMRTKMFDGMSFKKAIILVLAEAARPDDPEAVKAKDDRLEAMKAKLSEHKQLQIARFKRTLGPSLPKLTRDLEK